MVASNPLQSAPKLSQNQVKSLKFRNYFVRLRQPPHW